MCFYFPGALHALLVASDWYAQYRLDYAMRDLDRTLAGLVKEQARHARIEERELRASRKAAAREKAEARARARREARMAARVAGGDPTSGLSSSDFAPDPDRPLIEKVRAGLVA